MTESKLIEQSALGSAEDEWFSRPGFWFWSIIAVGIALRIYFVLFTPGTYDAGLWQLNAMGVQNFGLLEYYRANPTVNHPPFILELEFLVWRGSELSGIPFPILLRAPFVFLDGGTTWLLLTLLGTHRWRFVLAAAYWINPLSILLSSYQGNTDPAVAFFLLLAVWFLRRRQIAAGAIALGASLWIKLPGILALPALVLYVRGWRRRLLFLFLFGAAVVIGYLPALIREADVIAVNVFGYHGRMLQTGTGVALWGPRVLFFSLIAAPENWPEQLHAPVLFFLQHNWQIGLLLALILIFLRSPRRSIPQLCATIAMAYVTLCGVTDYWAFQYFAWSLPFWFFLRWWFFVPAIALVSAYVYSLYWTLCGNPWLLGTWDFGGHPYWPESVIIFRNLAVVFFFVSACAFLIAAIVGQTSLRRRVSRRARYLTSRKSAS